jgi:hypothetical protein
LSRTFSAERKLGLTQADGRRLAPFGLGYPIPARWA